MRIVILREVVLEDSNVADSALAEYAAATTYALGDKKKVSFESDGTTPRTPVFEYESLADANTGNYPPDNPDKWIETGAANKWKMLDDYTNTETVNDEDIEVAISANASDCVGIFGIYGQSVTLRLVRNAVTIKEETIDLRTYVPESGWYSWLYDYYDYGVTQILWDFPKYSSGATLEIVITARPGEDLAKCGMVCIGNSRRLASTLYDLKAGIEDYSVKDTDALGRTYLNQGAYADRVEAESWLKNTEFDYVKRQLTQLRGTAAIFDFTNGATQYQAMVVYGYFQSFDLIIPGPVTSKCSIEIKGLI